MRVRFYLTFRRGFKLLGISELLANFSAFIDSKCFDLSNSHVHQIKSQIMQHVLMTLVNKLYLKDITMVFYPQLTKFWIILIFKSSEDLALIR